MTYKPETTNVIYLTSGSSDSLNYKRVIVAPVSGTELTVSGSATSSSGSALIGSWVTDALGVTTIANSNWEFDFYVKVSDASGNTGLSVFCSKLNSSGSETSLFNFSVANVDELTPILHNILYNPSSIALLQSDRLVFKVYMFTDSVSAKTLTLYYLGNTNQSRIIVPADIPVIGDMLKSVYDQIGNGIEDEGTIAYPMGFLNQTESTLSYNQATRTITLSPTNNNYQYWLSGKRYLVNTSASAQHPNTTGTYFFYYNSNNVLTFSTTPYNILTDVPISYVYYNATTGSGLYFEERHQSDRNPEWHYETHFTTGTYLDKINGGLGLSNYVLNSSTSDADINWSIASGILHDEDIRFISGSTISGSYNLLYRSGVNGDWAWDIQTVPEKYTLSGYINYNTISSGSWVQTELGSTNFVNYYIIVTPSLTNGKQVFVLQGQQQYTSLATAQAETISSFSWGTMPFQEIIVAYQITYGNGSGYGTTGKVRIRALSDLRAYTGRQIVSAGTLSNHNNLGGLQGGTAGEYYHLTATQYNNLSGSSSSGSGGGHVIINSSGSAMPQETNLKFVGATVTDSSGSTVVTITSGSGGGGTVINTPTEVLLYDATLSSAGIFDVQNIPQGYDHLRVNFLARTTITDYGFNLTINGDTTDANYFHTDHWYGSSTGYGRYNNRWFGYIAGSDSPAGHFGSAVIEFQYYSGNKEKWYHGAGTSQRASNTMYTDDIDTNWVSTSAINRLTFDGTTFDVGTRLQIYGIKASSDASITTNFAGTHYDYICIQDQKAQGTEGGTFTSGAWRTRDLNTIVAGSEFVTVGSNQITLPAGTYEVSISAPALRVNKHKAILYSVSGSATLLEGSSSFSPQYTDFGSNTLSIIEGKITLLVSTILEVRHQCETTYSTNGWGMPSTFSTEVYTIAEFWKETSGTVLQTSTKTIRTETVLYDVTLSSAGTFDTLGYDLSGYDDLKVEFYGRGTRADINDYLVMSLNNDTTDANYHNVIHMADSSYHSAFQYTDRQVGVISSANSPANSFGLATVDIPNYNSSVFKTCSTVSSAYINTSDNAAFQSSSTWKSTSAITRIAMQGYATANFAIGSRLRVIGIKNEPFVNAVSGEGSGTISGSANEIAVLSGTGGIISSGSTISSMLNFVNVPTSASATGSKGQFSASGSYIYVCYAPNSWSRVSCSGSGW